MCDDRVHARHHSTQVANSRAVYRWPKIEATVGPLATQDRPQPTTPARRCRRPWSNPGLLSRGWVSPHKKGHPEILEPLRNEPVSGHGRHLQTAG